MAGEHWEARRKQNVLERAANARQRLEFCKSVSPAHSSASSTPSSEITIPGFRKRSEIRGRQQMNDQKMRRHAYDSIENSGKIPVRYSSTNYNQQW